MNYRIYGPPPYHLVLVHGGPGAAGSLAPLAKELSAGQGVIEALQTAHTIKELLEELYSIVQRLAIHPVTMIGHSWGAWLSLLFAGHNPGLVRKLILVGSAPFEERYVPGIMETRMNRLDEQGRDRLHELFRLSDLTENTEKDAIFGKIAGILRKTDAYAPLLTEDDRVEFDFGKYQSIWAEAEQMRKNGELLDTAGKLSCPVLAIHGDHDPHPPNGVRIPLGKKIRDFRFLALEKCGHEPWIEEFARKRFFEVLKNELASGRNG